MMQIGIAWDESREVWIAFDLRKGGRGPGWTPASEHLFDLTPGQVAALDRARLLPPCAAPRGGVGS